MRWLLVAVGLMAPISGAAAQEFELPTLRGSQAFAPNAPDCCTSWGGFYVGGQVGFGVTTRGFLDATQDLVAQSCISSRSRPSSPSPHGRCSARHIRAARPMGSSSAIMFRGRACSSGPRPITTGPISSLLRRFRPFSSIPRRRPQLQCQSHRQRLHARHGHTHAAGARRI